MKLIEMLFTLAWVLAALLVAGLLTSVICAIVSVFFPDKNELK